MAEQVPPGRAGRLWLAARLAAAVRGAELLDRKRLLLRSEHDRRLLRRDETARRWEQSCLRAERWAERAGVLGGEADVAMVADAVAGLAVAEVRWCNTMGVVHPDDARCAPATPSPDALAAANAALAPAAAAFRDALDAAVAHAVAAEAFRRVEVELDATQRRLRGIERHRVPNLRRALQDLTLRLEELEREERVVTRWAQGRHERSRSPGAGRSPS